MANLYLCPDDFWRCPIDLNHQVLAKRFPYHIRRCMIANPHIRRVRCVFNANHLTTPDDLLAHMATCPDAISTSTVLIGLSNIPPGRSESDQCHRLSEPTNWKMFHDVNATEDWDDDIRERRVKSAAISEQSIHASMKSTPVVLASEPFDPKVNKISNKLSTSITKQALVFEEYEYDGRIHPVETDDITKNLMKIRTLQLIGGAGRGACCLLRPAPPIPNHSPYKLSH